MDNILDLLEEAEDVFGKIPSNVRMEVARLEKTMPVSGQRLMKKAGSGADIFELRDFDQYKDEERKISAKHKMRTGKDIVLDRELESPHHFAAWVDASESMNFKSDRARFTKREYALIVMLAWIMDLGVQEEAVGVLSHGRLYRSGARTAQRVSDLLVDAALMGGDELPEIHRAFKANDMVVLGGDFFTKSPEDLENLLDDLAARRLQVTLMLTLDPDELDFPYTGNREFMGMEGETSLSGEASRVFDNAASMRAQYLAAIKAHITGLQTLCEERGFRFILAPTHKPPEQAVLNIKDGQENPMQHMPEIPAR